MNKVVLLILIVIGIDILQSCKKEEKQAECDINGVWLGYWESPSGYSGTFITNVNQFDTDFSGEILIRFNSATDDNFSDEFEGVVKEKEVRCVMYYYDADIKAIGNVNNDTIVTGTFSVTDYDINGSFDGRKLPTSSPAFNEIYSLTSVFGGESINDILLIKDNLWLFMSETIYINDELKTNIIKTDFNGNEITSILFPYIPGDVTFDGEFIWTIYNGSVIYKLDTLGNILNTFNTPPSGSFTIAGYNSKLYFTQGSKIIVTDQNIIAEDTVHFEFNYPYEICFFKENIIYSTSNNIFKANQNGKLLEAFKILENIFITSIVSNGESLFCLAQIYNDFTAPPSYIIYKIDIE